MVAKTHDFRCVIPGEPVAQGRPRASVRGGKPFMRDPEKSRSWKGKAAVLMRAAMSKGRHKPFRGPIEATILAYWPSIKPDRKRTPRRAELRPKRPDGDNIAKAVMDAAQGVLFEDDAQVVRLVVEKWHAAQGDMPRVEVSLKAIGWTA